MTVQNLIDILNKVKDKNMLVFISDYEDGESELDYVYHAFLKEVNIGQYSGTHNVAIKNETKGEKITEGILLPRHDFNEPYYLVTELKAQ